MKQITVLLGSPRKGGNTNALANVLLREFQREGFSCAVFSLYEMDLRPCLACRACQRDWSVFGCPQEDDMQTIFNAVLESDLLVLATPIYSWYCTPPMKTVLDRLVYGMNKYYGAGKGPSLWQGKALALLATCGYPIEKGADLFESGMRRYCRHSRLRFLGMHAERHLGYDTAFLDEEKERRTAAFAKGLTEELARENPAESLNC